MTESWAVQLEDVRRVFAGTRRTGPRTALDRLTLKFQSGATTALLGPNGSGKSTLLRIIATLDEPTEGRVRWFGETEGATSDRRARIGVVLQTASLDLLLTGRENLCLQGAVFGLRRDEVVRRIDDVAAEVGVRDRLDDRVGALSGGLRRRMDLARALLPAPRLLLLDEATAGLDPPSRADFWACVEQYQARSGMTVILSTHLMEEAERADRVVMMHEGRVVADGAPRELRSALAGAEICLWAPIEAADLLQSFGLDAVERDGALTATAPTQDHDRMAQAGAALAARGYSVRLGATTLEDVFIARTGRSLDAEGQDA